MKLRELRPVATVTAMVTAALLSGCATVDTSNNIGFSVKTKPEGAHVFAYSKTLKETVKCISPCTMTLRQTHDYLVTIKKKGYETHHIKVKSEDSVEGDAGSFGQNLLTFGVAAPIGMVVDGVSGADDRLFPGHANVTLKALNASEPLPSGKPGKKVSGNTKIDKTGKPAQIPDVTKEQDATPPVSSTKSAS